MNLEPRHVRLLEIIARYQLGSETSYVVVDRIDFRSSTMTDLCVYELVERQIASMRVRVTSKGLLHLGLQNASLAAMLLLRGVA